MKYTLHFLLCMVMFCVQAEVARAQDTAAVYKNRLHFSPLRAVGVVNPGWEVGYERMFGKRFSGKLLGAWLHNNLNVAAYDTYNGYRLGAEGKRFFGFSERANAYLSLEAIYNNVDYTTALPFRPENAPSPSYKSVYYDSIEVRNRNLSLNFKVGVQYRFGRFMMDFYGGLGLKYKQLAHAGRLQPNDHAFSRHPNIYLISASEMNGLTANVPLNFTVAYCF